MSFDPFTQSFTLLLPDGVTPFNVTIPQVNEMLYYNSDICINYGTQVGAVLTMLVVLLLVTRESKRRSAIFVVNVLSLIFCFIRNVLLVTYWVGPFVETYAHFSGDYERVPRSAYANSVAATVMALLFLAAVELSLVLQTHVVCVTMTRRVRSVATGASCAVALAAVGVRFADMVLNIEAILAVETTYNIEYLASAALILETITIWFFSLIFLSKLCWTLYQRRQMGLKQWTPMKIICIMSGCTMVIPSIFAVLEYYPSVFPEAGSLALTLVAIFLPLSSIWAAASIDAADPLRSASTSGSCCGGHAAARLRFPSDRSPTSTVSTAVSSSARAPILGKPPRGRDPVERELDELDGVLVERTISVHSGRKSTEELVG